MYIETSGRSPGQKALLVSPPLDGSDKCLQFYHHMLGSDIAQLNINLRDVNTSKVTRLWNLHGSKDKWVEAKVPLNFSRMSQVSFRFARCALRFVILLVCYVTLPYVMLC